MQQKRDNLLLLFDLDGTLIDSAKDLANSINFMLKALNKKTYDEKTITKWIGNGGEILIKRALSGGMEIKKINENEFIKAKEIFFNHYKNNLANNTIIYDGVVETLKKLPYKKVIITNKPHQFVKPILEKLNLIDYFDGYFGGDYFKEKKPSPLPLIKACEIFNTNPNNAIMIGDSKNDIIAAKKAKIKNIAVDYGYNQGENIKNYKPDVIINDFRKLLEVVR